MEDGVKMYNRQTARARATGAKPRRGGLFIEQSASRFSSFCFSAVPPIVVCGIVGRFNSNERAGPLKNKKKWLVGRLRIYRQATPTGFASSTPPGTAGGTPLGRLWDGSTEQNFQVNQALGRVGRVQGGKGGWWG